MVALVSGGGVWAAVSLVGALITAVSLLHYLVALARRIPDSKLARQTRTATVLTGIVAFLAWMMDYVNALSWAVPSHPLVVSVRALPPLAVFLVLVAIQAVVLGTCLYGWLVFGSYRRAFKAARDQAVQLAGLLGTMSSSAGGGCEEAETAGRS
jgi:hypothetical protein